jgi:excisionase family DNA binding protein
MTAHNSDGEALLTPAEVAALFRVDPKTVTRWAKAGKLTSIRTLGGHRRYRSTEVYSLLDRVTPSVFPTPAVQVPVVRQRTPQDRPAVPTASRTIALPASPVDAGR